jgi:aminomethyltransferase
MNDEQLKRTPFYEQHVAAGAKMVPFAGYEMPVQYEGITKEHEAVRTAVGVFDVSHMGEFEFTGPDRNAWVNRLTCNDVAALAEGQAQYTALLNEQGTFIDDCIIYRFDDRIMMVVNAANMQKDWAHVVSKKGGINARVKNVRFDVGNVTGVECFVARTGYTGEDGFELYFRPAHAATLWHAVAGAGRATPCGLGARDTLRLEMGYALYGNDIDDTVNPLEARLGWIVKLDKGAPFLGREALRAVKDKGVHRRLVGFRCVERAIPRHGYEVYLKDRKVDVVRSGGFSPTLQQGIGTTFLPTHSVTPGAAIEIGIRGKRVAAEVVKMPFYTGGSVRKD